jgi:hypothetical protein
MRQYGSPNSSGLNEITVLQLGHVAIKLGGRLTQKRCQNLELRIFRNVNSVERIKERKNFRRLEQALSGLMPLPKQPFEKLLIT